MTPERHAQLAEIFAATEANRHNRADRLRMKYGVSQEEWSRFVDWAFFGIGEAI